MRILLLSEDNKFNKKLVAGLKQASYQVDEGKPLDHNAFWVRSTDYDLVIIEHADTDMMIEACQTIRSAGKTMPLMLIVEAINSEEATHLFNCGIDDYASKFTGIAEIVARAKALLRRPKQYLAEQIVYGDLILDCHSYTVSRAGQSVYLTKKEFGILEYLLRHTGKVLSRTHLIEHVWDIHADLFSNSLETHILNLRKKIDVPGLPKLIHTVSGRGYKIAA